MGKIFDFDCQIYPLRLWVSVEPSIEECKRRFEVMDDDDETKFARFTDDTIKPYWGACRITVSEYKTGRVGCLIAIMHTSSVTVGQIAHEASHAYDDFAMLLKLPYTGEARAYLTEWITDRVYDVFMNNTK